MRGFAAAVAVLLAAMGAAMLSSSLGDNDIYDEGGHLAAGYGYLKIQDFGFNAEHPPLGNMLSALPLLVWNPRLATEHPSWRLRAAPIAGAIFLYRNRVRPATLLLAGRAVTMAFTLLLGAVLAIWTRRRFGAAAALLALFLYATDPNFAAHGHYITTDVFAAFFIFVACLAWDKYLKSGAAADLAAAGVVLGMALAVKFSALVLVPVFALLELIERGRPSVRRMAEFSVACCAAIAVVGVSYWPDTWKVLTGDLPLAQHPCLLGFQYLAEHNRAGRPAYLLGELSNHGWWYYFPVAFAVKTPTAALLLLPAALFFGRRRAVLVVPPLVYFLVSLTSNLNLGIRHLLPVYPFLLVLAATGLFRLKRRILIPVLVLTVSVQLFEWIRVYPHYLAFFNTISGGSGNGWRYLADSNLDWGQDVKRLKTYLDSRGIEEVCLAYFGTTDVAYHGVRRRHLPETPATEVDCVGAVSVNLLLGLYVKPGSYGWLRELEPAAKVGQSIYVYDLRKDIR
jgi:4-amino-4-deoxy-L-arabinose transferase-like glycosyltransferase